MAQLAAQPTTKARQAVQPPRSMRQLVWRRFRQHRAAVAGLVMLGLILALCTLVPLVQNYDSLRTNVDRIREAPSLAHIFGTDELGRDLFTRLWAGGRVSLLIGLATMLIAVVIGTVVGALSGFYSGWVDTVLMRFTDFMLSIPTLFLLLLFAQLLRSTNNPTLSGGPLPIVIIIGVLSWMGIARLVRGQFLALKTREFVEAGRALGVGSAGLIFKHILPNAASPIIVAATLRVGAAIITESTLSFLGFGVQPPTPTWGNMLKNAQAQMTYAPWTAIFPGLAIFLTVLSINYIGDGLRDALDPRTLIRAKKQG